MQCRFIHAADIHLGYAQYNLDRRADDFATAYFDVVEHAVSAGADFLLIAGDLFHRANTDAWTLKQAIHGLETLRRAGIPVVAIEGNHDAQHYHKHISWMQFLCDQELLVLLNVVRAANDYRSLEPFDPETRRGSFIDIAGARIYGLKYHGAATARLIEEVADQIEPGPEGYTILMLHAGLEGQVPNMHGGLTFHQLQPLRPPRADYLALGHIHKRLIEDNWLFNPGSTETNSMEELDWPHGFFDVSVDTTAPARHEVTQVESPHLRPFRRISIGAEGCASLHEFSGRVDEAIANAKGIPENAVVELYLGGMAEFRRQDLPLEQFQAAAELRFQPLTVRIRNNLVPPGAVTVSGREHLSREELERQVVERLVYQNAEYRDSATAWARLILDVKRMAVEKSLPESVVEHVRADLRRLAAPPVDEAVPETELAAVDLIADASLETDEG